MKKKRLNHHLTHGDGAGGRGASEQQSGSSDVPEVGDDTEGKV